jgi:uncharacterized protein
VPGTPIREFVDNTVDPNVRGFLHLPETSNHNALVLTHGAGSNAQAPLLVALADTFCAAGFTVLRCNLPYRQTRPYGPPGPGDAARDRAGLKNAITAIKTNLGAPFLARSLREKDCPEPVEGWGIFLAGHSYGGRQASMLCSELAEKEPELVAGLLLLSYPLNPPRRPEQQRTQHLPNLRTPALFVQGTRDPFGAIGEIERALKMIPARTKLLTVEGAGHDLGFKGKARQDELPGVIFSEFITFFDLSL